MDRSEPPSRYFGRRAVAGAAWLSTATVANGVIGALVSIFLARLLGPGPLGQYALAIAVSDVAAMAVGWGIDVYLVQARRVGPEELGTALSFSLVLSAFFLVLSSGLALAFLWRGQPQVAALLPALAIQRLWLLLGACFVAMLQRGFLFGRLAAIQLVAGVTDHAVAIGVALLGGGIWALLGRDMVDSFAVFFWAWLVSRAAFRPVWRPAIAGAMGRFGAAMFMSQAGDLSANRLDSTVLGLTWGTTELAFYGEAYKLADVSRRASQPALSQVALPAYARLRTDAERRSATFRTVQGIMVCLVAPFVLSMLILPETLIQLLFGSQWLGAVPMARAFAGYAALYPFFDHLRQLLLSHGEAPAVARARVAQLVVFLAALGLLLPHWGGEGAALAVDAGVLTALIMAAAAARRYLRRDLALWRTYAPPVLCAALAAAIILGPAHGAPALARQAGLWLCYGLALVWWHRADLWRLRGLLARRPLFRRIEDPMKVGPE